MSFDPTNLTHKAVEMQNRMTKVQEKLATLEITGSAGVGDYMVTVSLNGKYEATKVSIASSLLEQKIEILNDLVAAAITNAAHKTGAAIQQEFLTVMQEYQTKT